MNRCLQPAESCGKEVRVVNVSPSVVECLGKKKLRLSDSGTKNLRLGVLIARM